GVNTINGVVSYAGSTATFAPASTLAGNTLYTATIVNTVKDLAGNNMVNNYVWTFTTGNAPDLTPPTVISTLPVNLATNVPVNVIPSATFSELMDPSTINNASFTLKQGVNTINGVVSYAGSTATFAPASTLAGNTLYTATIVNTVKDLAGNNMVNNYVWTFTTVSIQAPTVISTDPENLETGVQLNKIITADFSEMMNPMTINNASFTLKIGTTTVAGQVSYSGVRASFAPTSNLLSGTTYIATITTAAQNLAGVSLENNFEWTFSTSNPAGAPFVELNSVARFGIIAGVGISNNAGFSVINDQDVGISPGVRSSITGFPPAIVVNGAIYASDDIAPPGVAAMLIQAKLDLTEAYLFAEGATVPAPATVSGDQGGLTLYPGIYKSTSTLLIQSGDLTLDAQGDENAVWIFQVASGFTTVGGAGGNVILSGGAQAKNVFWQTGTSATIGDNTSFKGNILALTSITMNSGAVAQGRMLCINGAIVLTNTNIINKP
ncbi:MAG: ice-binding family protein, partial [Bacteroidales bacterium]|nr:ice-binding family protein [Bacteroidales bacterium]